MWGQCWDRFKNVLLSTTFIPWEYYSMRRKAYKHTHIVLSSFHVGSLSRTNSVRYLFLPTPKITEALHTPQEERAAQKYTNKTKLRKTMTRINDTEVDSKAPYLHLFWVVNFALHTLRLRKKIIVLKTRKQGARSNRFLTDNFYFIGIHEFSTSLFNFPGVETIALRHNKLCCNVCTGLP